MTHLRGSEIFETSGTRMDAERQRVDWHEHVYGDLKWEKRTIQCLQLRRSAAKSSFCVSAQLDNLWPSACKTKPSRDSENTKRRPLIG